MLKVPNHTKIILIPDDGRASREYAISRSMVATLLILLLVLAAGIILMLVSLAGFVADGKQSADLQARLASADQRAATVQEINREMEQMRALQEHLLVMLGVQAPSVEESDSLMAYWAHAGEDPPADAIQRAAMLVMTPPPDRWPVGGFVTREYEEGDTPRGRRPHLGIDIAAPEGTPLVAAGSGRVLRARWDDYLGNFVEIQHGFGYVTVYGHCSSLSVDEGDRIEAGEVIGFLGGTGEASAPHLHFEVYKEGAAIDPRDLFPGDPPR